MIDNQTNPIDPNTVYKPNEAADLLRVDKSFIYKAYSSGELRGKEMGRGVKFLGSELLDYVGTATSPNSSKHPPMATSGVPSIASDEVI